MGYLDDIRAKNQSNIWGYRGRLKTGQDKGDLEKIRSMTNRGEGVGLGAATAGNAGINPNIGIDQNGQLASQFNGMAQFGNAQQQAQNAQQSQLGSALMQRALGTGGPSAAELQMQRGLGQAQTAAGSLAASQRGVGAGLALRNAQNAQAQMAGQNLDQTAQLRANEQIAAQQGLGNLLAQQRQQNIGQQQAGMQGQGDIQKVNAGLQNQQYITGMQGFYGMENTRLGKEDNRGWGEKALDALSDEREKTGVNNDPTKLSDHQIDTFGRSLMQGAPPAQEEPKKPGLLAQGLQAASMAQGMGGAGAAGSGGAGGAGAGAAGAGAGGGAAAAGGGMGALGMGGLVALGTALAGVMSQVAPKELMKMGMTTSDNPDRTSFSDVNMKTGIDMPSLVASEHELAGGDEPEEDKGPSWNNQDFATQSLSSRKPLKGAVDYAKKYAIGKGMAAAFSDERCKTQIDDFGKHLAGYQFKYKNPSLGEGPRMGVMAQDVDNSAIGKDVVKSKNLNGRERLALDVPNALGAALASIGRLQERIDQLERR